MGIFACCPGLLLQEHSVHQQAECGGLKNFTGIWHQREDPKKTVLGAVLNGADTPN